MPGGSDIETDATLADPGPEAGSGSAPVELETVDPRHYEFGEDVARGGMGVVRRARDRRTGRWVAIKELIGETVHPVQRRRFVREARITAQLQHPNIVPVYEIGQWPDGRPFFAMKLVGGRPFDVVADEALDADARLALVPRILPAVDAIASAHEAGIIHRDLKPANVLLGEFGETIVIDWGLAKGIGEAEATDSLEIDALDSIDSMQGSEQLTRAGTIVGTPAYMPPEQARAEPLDARADVYALGALLYHALCGRAPYEGGASQAVRALLTGPPTPLRTIAPNAPPDLVSIVDKAMARDPADRYADARELARDLDAFRTGRLVGAYEYTSWELLTRFVRRNRALSATLLLLVVLAAVAVAFIVREQRVAERERTRARGAEQRAVANELEVHRRLARAHARSASRRLRLGDHLGAELLAAAALRESPEHPRSPNRPESADASGARDPTLAGAVATWAAARALRFATRTRTLRHHTDWIYDVLVSPDDRWVVTTAADHRVIVWSAARGAVHRVLEGHEGNVFQAALDRDARRLATSSYDGTVRLWSFPDGAPIATIDHPADRVYGTCFAADGTLVSAGGDGRVAVFAPDGALRRLLPATDAIPWRLVCAQDAPFVLVGTVGPETIGLDLVSGEVTRRFGEVDDGRRAHTTMGVQLVGGRLVTVDEEGLLRRFDRATGGLLDTVQFDFQVESVAASPDGRWLALGGDDIALVDARTLRTMARLDGHRTRVVALAFDSRGGRLYSGSQDHDVVEWELPRQRAGAVLTTPGRALIDVVVEGPGGRLVAAGDDAIVRVWDLERGALQDERRVHTAPVRAAAFLDADTLATSGMDRSLVLHDLRSERSERVRELPHFGDELTAGEPGLALASGEGDLLIFGDPRAAPQVVSGVDEERTWWTAFDPGGRRLATAGFSGWVSLVDPEAARVVRRWRAHDARIYAASWRGDGEALATVDLEGELRVWDPETGARIAGWQVLGGEAGRSVAWSAEGRLLVTTDRGARVYDAEGTLLARLDTEARTTAAGWTRDGRMHFAAGGQVFVLPLDLSAWERDPGEMLAEAERAAGRTLEEVMER